jgi:hypothetical protein
VAPHNTALFSLSFLPFSFIPLLGEYYLYLSLASVVYSVLR